MKTELLRLFFSITLCGCTGLLYGQNSIGIGTTTPHSSAILDVASSGKGILVPRMSQTNRLAISNPANGLLVYDSTTNRLFQYQQGEWRYMLTNANWAQSSSRNWTYNTIDSVGIGITSPTERLDVIGTIQSRNTTRADGGILASGDISAATVVATTALIADGNATTGGTISAQGDIDLDNIGTTIQLQNNNDKKVYFQLSGNDLRMGTNSGNSAGKMIFRMNGTDAISIDRSANVELLQTVASQGTIVIGWKLCRISAPEINMLPVMFGYVPADGGPIGWMSPFNGGWEKVATGRYEISNYSAPGINPYCVIVATASGSDVHFCTASYVGPNKIRVEVFNRDGVRVDGAFHFVVNSPLN